MLPRTSVYLFSVPRTAQLLTQCEMHRGASSLSWIHTAYFFDSSTCESDALQKASVVFRDPIARAHVGTFNSIHR